jgi:antitoxin component YwqK of YwqJK toxin-antitoxin module
MKIEKINKENLKLEVEMDEAENSCIWKCVIDQKEQVCGEYIEYYSNGKIKHHSFQYKGRYVGAKYFYDKKGSILNSYLYSLLYAGKIISETEYRKQLTQYRLGLIECPVLEIFIKDYDEKGKIK